MHEARRAAEGVVERAASEGKARPARRVLGVAPKAGPQPFGDVDDLALTDGERARERLAGHVVWRPAEPSRDEHRVGGRRGRSNEGCNVVDIVRDDRDQLHRDTEALEPLGEPRTVRIRDVAGDELVADRDDRCRRLSAHPPAEYRRRDRPPPRPVSARGKACRRAPGAPEP